jgi:hypothetical protein
LSDWLYTGGTFAGSVNVDYVGKSARNYIPDAWVQQAAEGLGWSQKRLETWVQSVRHALDVNPVTQADFQALMAGFDS